MAALGEPVVPGEKISLVILIDSSRTGHDTRSELKIQHIFRSNGILCPLEDMIIHKNGMPIGRESTIRLYFNATELVAAIPKANYSP
jgi:hypothetical protein